MVWFGLFLPERHCYRFYQLEILYLKKTQVLSGTSLSPANIFSFTITFYFVPFLFCNKLSSPLLS